MSWRRRSSVTATRRHLSGALVRSLVPDSLVQSAQRERPRHEPANLYHRRLLGHAQAWRGLRFVVGHGALPRCRGCAPPHLPLALASRRRGLGRVRLGRSNARTAFTAVRYARGPDRPAVRPATAWRRGGRGGLVRTVWLDGAADQGESVPDGRDADVEATGAEGPEAASVCGELAVLDITHYASHPSLHIRMHIALASCQGRRMYSNSSRSSHVGDASGCP